MIEKTANKVALGRANYSAALTKLQEDSVKAAALDVEDRTGYGPTSEKSTAYEDFKKARETPAT
jgi:hypothetical protein